MSFQFPRKPEKQAFSLLKCRIKNKLLHVATQHFIRHSEIVPRNVINDTSGNLQRLWLPALSSRTPEPVLQQTRPTSRPATHHRTPDYSPQLAPLKRFCPAFQPFLFCYFGRSHLPDEMHLLVLTSTNSPARGSIASQPARHSQLTALPAQARAPSSSRPSVESHFPRQNSSFSGHFSPNYS